MKYRIRVNNGLWFTPTCEFQSYWAVYLYVKNFFGDIEITDYEVDPILPELLLEQA